MKTLSTLLALTVVLTSCHVANDPLQSESSEPLDLITAFQLTDINQDLVERGYSIDYENVVYQEPDYTNGIKIMAISAANRNGGRVIIGIADRLEYEGFRGIDVNAYITPAQVFLIEEDPDDPTLEEEKVLAGGRSLATYNPIYIYPYSQPWLAKYSVRQVTYNRIRITPTITSNSSILGWFRRCAYCVGKTTEKACKDPFSCYGAAHGVVVNTASCIWRGCPMDGYVYNDSSNPWGPGIP